MLPEPSIKGCGRFIQVDIEKMKEGGHDGFFLGGWWWLIMCIDITDIS